MQNCILTLICPDKPGIVHAVCGELSEIQANIVENAQFGEPDTNRFCMRTVFSTDVQDLEQVIAPLQRQLGDDATMLHVQRETHRPNVLIMVSKFDHCLVDLLYRWRNGGLPINIPVIVSNHQDCQMIAGQYDLPFIHMPITNENKAAQEAHLRSLLTDHAIDLVVLARYMQVLSEDLCRHLSGRIINIHHSFLHGFKGARPYHQAHDRGVKLVGATAHFVTADLDEGPIIEQDVARVNHSHTADQLVSLGQETERQVLSRAVRYCAEDRVLLVGAKTVVFS